MPPKGLDDVPAKTVDIDPAALDPLRLRLAQERGQCLIVEFLDGQVVLGEVDNRDIARGAQCRHGGMAPIGLARVYTWLGTGCRSGKLVLSSQIECRGLQDGHTMPARADSKIVKIIYRPEGSGAGCAAP